MHIASVNKLLALIFSILQDASDREKGTIKSPYRDMTCTVEDQNALSKEEQMNVLHRLGCFIYLSFIKVRLFYLSYGFDLFQLCYDALVKKKQKSYPMMLAFPTLYL